MSIQFILLPLFVQVALTFVLGFWLAGLRAPAVRRGEVRPRDVALREPNWPKPTLQVGNAYQNQFEAPVLYYLLTVLAVVTKQADVLFVVLSWVFVLSRVVHAYVHVTDNHLGRRGALFGIGAIVLAIMWLIFAAGILLGSA
ncbi:MAG: MAPEG family protein [Xanthobacteraceae bacterium]